MRTLTPQIASAALSIIRKRNRDKFNVSAKKEINARIPSRLNEKARCKAQPKFRKATMQYDSGSWIKTGKNQSRMEESFPHRY